MSANRADGMPIIRFGRMVRYRPPTCAPGSCNTAMTTKAIFPDRDFEIGGIRV